MSQTTSSPVNDDTITETAAQWFMRLQDQDCTDAERDTFAQWLAADLRHSREYEAMRATWQACDGLTPALSAAATPATTRPTGSRRPRRILALAALTGVLTLALGIAWNMGWVPSEYATYSAEGASRLVTLPDGSRVELNTSTHLSYARYKDRRIVSFEQGEAFFEVAHDALKPFVVNAGKGSIQAIGTRFNVWMYQDQVNVILVDGSVLVLGDRAQPDRNVRLTPGMQAYYRGHEALPLASQVRAGDASLAWRYGKLVFNDLPLRQALPMINRYLPTPIMLADTATGDLRLGLSYNISEISGLLASLPKVLPVRVAFNEQGQPVLHKQAATVLRR
ncbi:FecR family protein [Pseudomonas syringae]|nr:FecR family protein [Pseudomonas syringae]